MSNQVFVCPHCGSIEDCCDFTAEEKEYRTTWGTYSEENGHSYEDSEANDSETLSMEYKCHSCEALISGDIDEHFFEVDSDAYRNEIKRLIDEGTLDISSAPDIIIIAPNE